MFLRLLVILICFENSNVKVDVIVINYAYVFKREKENFYLLLKYLKRGVLNTCFGLVFFFFFDTEIYEKNPCSISSSLELGGFVKRSITKDR